MDTTNKLAVGGRYNWKGQRERLVYIGRNWSGNGYWHQFELVDRPGVIWCEVVDADLGKFEESQSDATQAVSEPVAWCELTPNGKIAYFDGKPMFMPGPVGNDCHRTPLYTHPAPASASEPAKKPRCDYPDCTRECGDAQGYCHKRCASASVAGAGEALPHPGGVEISALLDSILAEYGWPSNPKNAARAGWTAAMRFIAARPVAAPAPLSQAVPEGFWLAPMEPDTAMIRAAHYWEVDERVREFWNALRDHWLSRHPQPQAVTEDARDGERLDWLARCGDFCANSTPSTPDDFRLEITNELDDNGVGHVFTGENLRECVDKAMKEDQS